GARRWQVCVKLSCAAGALVREGHLIISFHFFDGSHAMRRVRVSIVIALLTLSALAGLQGWSYTAGEGVAASALRLSGTTGQEALNIVSMAGKDIDIGNNGPATAAILDTPRMLAVDSSGNVYVADVARVWRIDHATGIITTVAGTGSPGMGG